MKATGIVRKVDELGRIVLPIELRRTLGIDVKDPLEIYVHEDQIILKKYQPACIFCGSGDDVHRIHDKNVCQSCIDELKSLTKSFVPFLKRPPQSFILFFLTL